MGTSGRRQPACPAADDFAAPPCRRQLVPLDAMKSDQIGPLSVRSPFDDGAPEFSGVVLSREHNGAILLKDSDPVVDQRLHAGIIGWSDIGMPRRLLRRRIAGKAHGFRLAAQRRQNRLVE